MSDADALKSFGRSVDFGKTAGDYATHRAGFPPAFFDLLAAREYAHKRERTLDLGCGTGTVARGLAQMGLEVTGIDPSANLIAEALALDATAGVSVNYREGKAETTGLLDNHFDLITAGQCWHWFDRSQAATEARRLLRPGGRLMIAHFGWLPQPGNVVAATDALILSHNPAWAGAGGSGMYPNWLLDLAGAGFEGLETTSFDHMQPYTHAAWRGRIRASAGIAASLTAETTAEFDTELATLLLRDYPEDPLLVPHRVWLATGRRSFD